MISPNLFARILGFACTLGQVYAANDWSKPCFSGDCSYDVSPSNTSLSASLRVWGSTNAISDVTEAAGWLIMDCDSTPSSQAVRLVCKSADEDSAGCSHVLQNGAQDTLVRLPENCGKAPFAIITAWSTAADQSVSDEAMKKLDTSDKRAVPLVRSATLDSDFSKANSQTHGPVSFSVANNADLILSNSAPKSITRRDAGAVASEVASAAGAAESAVVGATGDANDVNVNQTTIIPISLNRSFNLATANTACGDLGDIKASADVSINTNASVTLGVVAGGTLVPPQLTSFSLSGGLNADLGGTLKLVADASGAPIDTGKIQIFSIGIPGLDIPDVLQVGPTFQVAVQAALDLSASVDMDVGLNFHVANAAFVFPPQASLPPNGTPSPQDSTLNLSVSPNITATGTLSAHIIPSLDFGLSAFAGKASATIDLAIDTSATITLSLGAGASLTQTASSGSVPDVQSCISSCAALMAPMLARRAAAAGGVQGCVDAKVGIAATAGAQGTLFGLLDDSTTLPLFAKEFELLSKCFGTQTSTKRAEIAPAPERAPALARRALQLQCPKVKAASAEPLVQGTVAAAQIQAV